MDTSQVSNLEGARSAPLDILVALNGPGEVTGWFAPFVKALKRREPGARVTAALLPCVFATGREERVLAESGLADEVLGVRRTLALILRGEAKPEALGGRRCLLHLGGEPLLSLLLALRTRRRAFAYAETPIAFARFFSRVFWASASLLPLPGNRGLLSGRPSRLGEENRGRVIGNLMADAVKGRSRCAGSLPGAPLTIGLFPGSREYQVRHMLQFFVKVMGDLRERARECRALLALSPFVELETLGRVACDHWSHSPLEGENSRLAPDGRHLVSDRGLRIDVLTGAEVMEKADLVLAVPGTATAELAAAGVPMVVVVPTYRAEVHPLPGLWGHLGRVPFLGRFLKRAAALMWLRHWRFTAHPNIAAGRMVVRELTGRVTADMVGDAVLNLEGGRLAAVSEELIRLAGRGGAADRLAEEMLSAMNWKRRNAP